MNNLYEDENNDFNDVPVEDIEIDEEIKNKYMKDNENINSMGNNDILNQYNSLINDKLNEGIDFDNEESINEENQDIDSDETESLEYEDKIYNVNFKFPDSLDEDDLDELKEELDNKVKEILSKYKAEFKDSDLDEDEEIDYNNPNTQNNYLESYRSKLMSSLINDEDDDLFDDDYEEEIDEKDIIYINCKKKDLSSFQRMLLKRYPNKYRLVKNKKQLSEKEELEKFQEKQDAFWNKLEKEGKKHTKTPLEKYNKHVKKKRMLQKHLNNDEKDKNIMMYMNKCILYKELYELYDGLLYNKKYSIFGEEVSLSKYGRDNKKKMSVLKSLEKKMLERLNNESLDYDKTDGLIVEYYDKPKSKRKR